MIKKSLLFATSVSLFLAACNTAPSNNQLQAPVLNTASNELSTNVSNEQSQDNVYRSLVIKPEQSFQTKGVVDSAKRAVVAKIGTVEYTLTYKFMQKMRDLLDQLPYATANTREAMATTGFFTRLKSASGVATLVDKPTVGEPAYTSNYTLSASETAFVTKLESYNAVVMPNFLPFDDLTPDTTIPSDLDTISSGTIKMIVNKTGIGKDFYKAVHYALRRTNNSAAGDFDQTAGDSVLYYSQIDAATSAAAFTYTGVAGAGDPATISGSLFKFDSLAATALPSAAEKTFLTSLVNGAPYVKDVVLLNVDDEIVSGNVGINFGYNDALTSSFSTGEDLMEWNGLASPNAAYPIIADNTPDGSGAGFEKVATQPAATANLAGAAAVVAASALIDDTATPGAITGLSSIDTDATAGTMLYDFSPPASFPISVSTKFGAWHQGIRALHMYAGGATATAAPATALAFTGLTTLAAVAAASVTAPVITTELGGSKNLFEAAEYMFGTTDVHKLVKSTATTNKNQQAIVNFFYENDPTAVPTGSSWNNTNVPKRALIVPCTRTVSATGVASYVFSPSGTSYVVITAEPTTYPGLDFYMTDPAGKPLKSGLTDNGAFYQLVIDNPALIGALYNYTGTLVGVKKP